MQKLLKVTSKMVNCIIQLIFAISLFLLTGCKEGSLGIQSTNTTTTSTTLDEVERTLVKDDPESGEEKPDVENDSPLKCAVCGTEDHVTKGCQPGTYADAPDTESEYVWYCENIPNQIGNCGGTVPFKTCSSPKTTENHIFSKTQTSSQRKADFLIVIDHSDSMNPYQQELGNRFHNLTSHLNDIDWQMAFINTNKHNANTDSRYTNTDGDRGVFYYLEDANGEYTDANGQKVNILKKSDENASNFFLNTIQRGGKGDNDLGRGQEHPLATIMQSLNLSANKTFFKKSGRSDAALVLIVLVNEGPETTPADTFIKNLKSKFGANKKIFAHGIIDTTNTDKELQESCQRVKNNQQQDREYCTLKGIKDLVNSSEITGGSLGEITNSSYEQTLEKISENLAKTLKLKTIELPHKPILNTLEVSCEPSGGCGHYNPKSNPDRIEFDDYPKDGTTITISYEYYK